MSPDLSKKIRFFSFLNILLVILLHSYNAELMNVRNLNWYVQNFISNGVCRVAVPFFFLMSGFLFFRDVPDSFSFAFFVRKIKTRVWSNAVPYFVITLSGLMVCWAVFCFHPGVVSGVTRSFRGALNYIFVSPRLSYQLWFLRDLFVLQLFSPLLFFITRQGILSVLLLLILLLGNTDPLIFRGDSFFYFCVGAVIASNSLPACCRKLVHLNGLLIIFFVCVWISSCVLRMQYHIVPILLVGEISGMISLWNLYDKVSHLDSFTGKEKLLTTSFFLYLFHEPLMSLLRKSFLPLCPLSQGVLMLLYFILPVIVIVFLVKLSLLGKKWFPRTYSLITGGREKK